MRLLGRFDVRYIVSADNLRCVQTVQPLSESIGVQIADESAVSEDGYGGNEQQAEQLIRELGEDGEAVVVCSQRDVIPDLITRLAKADGIDLPNRPKAKKAAVWSLSFEGPRLIGLEQFAPPQGLGLALIERKRCVRKPCQLAATMDELRSIFARDVHRGSPDCRS